MSESPELQPLPEGSILLHVGMGKTGTTTLQGAFDAKVDDLKQQGVFAQTIHQPARALRQTSFGDDPVPDFAEWTGLVDVVREWTGPRTVLSSELLAGATDDDARRIVDDLSADRLHVIIGVRNFASSAVSLWQQRLKWGRVATLDNWLDRNFVRTDENPNPKFWHRRDPVAIAERWIKLLGADRVNVIVVDPRDHDFQPSVFEHLLALTPGSLSSVEVYTNRGMTAVEAELVRKINVRLRKKLSWPEYQTFVRYGPVRQFLEHRVPPKSEPRLTASGPAETQALKEGQRVAEALTASGVRIIGDLTSLTESTTSETPVSTQGQPEIPTDLAVQALLGAVKAAIANSRGEVS